jgi:hypothetical protein
VKFYKKLMKNPELENKILKILSQDNPPDTVEGIFDELLKTTFAYKFEISRAVWKLASEGRLVVLSGRITTNNVQSVVPVCDKDEQKINELQNKVFQLGCRVSELENELERERLRLAACGAVAMADTPESAAEARHIHEDFWSASLGDVIRQIDTLMSTRNQLKALQERSFNGGYQPIKQQGNPEPPPKTP